MRRRAILLAALLLAGPSTAPSQEPDPAAWTRNLGIADLANSILVRTDLAVERHGMDRDQAERIRAEVRAVREGEKAWRAAGETPKDAFPELMARLRALAVEVADVPTRRPSIPVPTEDWSPVPDPHPLNLAGFRLTFQDEFDKPSITLDGGKGPWYSPVHADFGAAKFSPPGPDGPFFYKKSRAKTTSERSLLEIHAKLGPDGWTGGLIQTVDGKGRGFAQTYGYFEMRAKLPPGKATWPAFWLLTQNAYLDPYQDRGEIDVLEHYGTDPSRLHVAVHLKPPNTFHAGGIERPWYKSNKIPLSDHRDGFHRYGVLVDPEWVTIYYDRRPLTRFPTQDAYRGPMYLLVDLTMHPKGLEEADNPSIFTVDYVRVYALPAR